jgi:hypothetical protein
MAYFGGLGNPIALPAATYVSTVTLSATGTGADGAIVGSGSQSFGHSAGVTLVPAVAGKVIVPLYTLVQYTFATGAYAGGGTLRTSYSTSGGLVAISPTINAQFFFVTTAYSSSFFLYPTLGSGDATTTTATAFINVPVVIQGTAYTAGTGAGTAVINTAYILITP